MANSCLYTFQQGHLIILVSREKRISKKCKSTVISKIKGDLVKECIRSCYNDLGFCIGQNPIVKENEISYSFLDLETSKSICDFIKKMEIKKFQIVIIEFNNVDGNCSRLAKEAFDGLPRAYSVTIDIEADDFESMC